MFPLIFLIKLNNFIPNPIIKLFRFSRINPLLPLSTELDERWDALGIWQDSNQDGITDPGEFSSLDDRGITTIDLIGDRHHEHYDDGSVLFGTTSYSLDDGSTGIIGDLRLAYDADDAIPSGQELRDLVNVPGSAAEVFDRQESFAPPDEGECAH